MPLSIAHLVPLGKEIRWSDLLAVLVEADPASVAQLLGLPGGGAAVTVQREVVADTGDVADLLVHPGRLVIDVSHVEGWRAITWKRLLTAFDSLPGDVRHHQVEGWSVLCRGVPCQ